MKIHFLYLSLLFSFTTFAQNDDLAASLRNGIELHDRGEYEKALAVYDEIIKDDENYYDAWHEKTLTLFALKRYTECISVCEQTIKKFDGNPQNGKVYSNWGSAVDDMGDYKQAIKIYGKGIKKYPGDYMLHLNRGITEYKHQLVEDATEDMQQAITINPMRASAHQYLAYSINQQNKMAAVLSLSTFLLLEPDGPRAEKNLEYLINLLGSNVKREDEKNITITLSPQALNTKKKGADDFSVQEMTIVFQSALDHDEKYKSQNAAEKLRRKLEIFCDASGDKGFFTTTYIPLLKQLNRDSLLETASYYIYASSLDKNVKEWIQANPAKIQSLQDWLKSYQWKKE